MVDLVVTGGRVLDGCGGPWYWADVAVDRARVVSVARTSRGSPSSLSEYGKARIDAAGAIVAPGFIDMHSHSDHALLVNRTANSKVMQGVTTEVIGQCGNSMAPLTVTSLPLMRARARGLPEVDWDWQTYGQYLERLAGHGTAVNVVGLVGHGTLRTSVMGYAQRHPTPEELHEICSLTRQSMEEGAFGISTGLIYAPGSYSDAAELVTLARAVAASGGSYVTHLRSEGSLVLKALGEAIGIGRLANLPVQVSHLKVFGLSRGKASEVVEALEAARDCGVDIAADQYPYSASSTGLAALLPAWAHEGGRESLIRRLEDARYRNQIKADMMTGSEEWPNDFRGIGWDRIHVSSSSDAAIEGRTIRDIAEDSGEDPYDTVFRILAGVDAGTSVVIHGMSEDDVRLILAHDLVMIGSDGSALNATGPLSKGRPHPRNYGTFPRVLAKYVRDEGLISLAEAVSKMTSVPASRLGLADRGQIREGWWADLVVFRPRDIRDTATFVEPHQYPEGIDAVIVNGAVVVESGQHTGRLPGQVLRRT